MLRRHDSLARLLACLGLIAGLANPAAAAPASVSHAMVAAANPLAADAGLKVLKAGGSAVDAAVAVQAVLGLVEPQSSGVGGGAFMVYLDAATGRVTAYDGREMAPAGATPDMFQKPDGTPMSFADAVLSGRSAGTPGAIALLSLAQKEHGRRPWRSLFTGAERLAEDGFAVSPRLASEITWQVPETSAPDVTGYFTKPDGTRLKAGDVLKNPAYAATLRRIAAEGPPALLTGKVARDIVSRLAEEPLPGTMTLADLAAYRPREGPALCRPYRIWVVCTAQAPSGGPALLEALGLLEHTDIASRGPGDPQAWLQLAEAERLMYADRDAYEGDPAFVPFPLQGLLDPAYLKARASLIGDHLASAPPLPGHPAGLAQVRADATREPGGTSHFVVVDAQGDVVSMTTTVESAFGDGRMVDGFFLNNQLTDFSFTPKNAAGAPAANAVAPHKRPRSSMAPVIVLDRKGRFVLALGSPGGSSILSYNLKALVAALDWRLPLDQAFALPNLVAHGPNITSEPDRYAPSVIAGLAAKGVAFKPSSGENSGLHGVARSSAGLQGAADDRREGVAVGY
jgi:gamma-glutamyltranspeptidase/glutathione hydrolase